MELDRENISINEAVRIFGIGRTKIYELIQAGDVVAFKLGRRTLLDSASLRNFIGCLPKIGEGR